ncbi:O-antigen ligase family protein [Clostridium aestuarii]|uniref:O-antigen ligase family protein n=1 Tax=Clostridium aestuarii TaxID=338193 RepID=A0ABT4D3W9_9CLOT|nr:O-antigen ligase family protein [Clostridium aestuarii]MCY6484733.1 O-antigen ligase family protein [Clostridium aestuarii]
MVFLSILLIVFSPYLAFLPMISIGFKAVHKNNLILRNIWNIGLFFLFIWSFLVGIINTNKISVIASLAILFYFFFSVYLQNYYNTVQQIEQLFKKIMLISVGSGIIGFIERFKGIQYKYAWWKCLIGIYPPVSFSESYRISGTFGNPNIAGTWYAVMVLMCFYFYKKSLKIEKIFYIVLAALFISVLFMTESRGAIIGLILGMITYAYFREDKKKMIFLILFFTLGVILMFIFPHYFPRGEGVFTSIEDRKAIWRNCLNMFKFKPVTGWGLMGIYFADKSIYHYIRVVHGHNILITIATTLGAVGASIFVCMKLYLFKEIWFLNKQHCPLSPLLAGIEAIILGQGLVDFTIMSPQAGIIFFGCSAIINGLAFQYKSVPLSECVSIPFLSRAKNK